jgi:hypothetical protein
VATQSNPDPLPFDYIRIKAILDLISDLLKQEIYEGFHAGSSTNATGVATRHPLKAVLKSYWKPPGKSVNLQDAQPHGLRPGAPGPHRQVLGAAFEPQMSIWAPVVLGVSGVVNLVCK